MSAAAHRLLFQVWRRVPSRAQHIIIYLLGHRITVGVAAVVLDARGAVLLVHHTYRSPAWDYPGGLLGRHEQPAAALERELREELGVSAVAGRLLHADHYTRRRHMTLYYDVGIVGTPRHGVETDAHRYVLLGDLPGILGTSLPAWLNELVRARRPT